MLELRHLRYFVRRRGGAEFQSCRRAAAHGPAAAQRRDPALEQELGTELLLRTTREVRLTEAGQTFLEGAIERSPNSSARVATPSGQPPAKSDSFGSGSAGARGSRRCPRSAAHSGAAIPTCRCSPRRCGTRGCSRRSAPVDRLAVSLCPEIAGEFPTRRFVRAVLALLAESHPLAYKPGLALRDLADEGGLSPPRARAAALRRSRRPLPTGWVRAAPERRLIPQRLGAKDPGRLRGSGARPGVGSARASQGHRRDTGALTRSPRSRPHSCGAPTTRRRPTGRFATPRRRLRAPPPIPIRSRPRRGACCGPVGHGITVAPWRRTTVPCVGFTSGVIRWTESRTSIGRSGRESRPSGSSPITSSTTATRWWRWEPSVGGRRAGCS